jgi:hypothetical protein
VHEHLSSHARASTVQYFLADVMRSPAMGQTPRLFKLQRLSPFDSQMKTGSRKLRYLLLISMKL